MVGGGDSACEDAMFLSRMVDKVFMIVRRGELSASKIMQDRVLANSKIEVVWNCVVEEYVCPPNTNKLDSVMLKKSGALLATRLKVAAVFLAIGHEPNTDFLKRTVELDHLGYIATQ